MKKTMIFSTVLSIALFIGYAAVNAQAPDKEFSAKQLSEFDGKDDAKAYVAIDGIVYDVTLVKAWKGGKHKMGLTAGKDLSDWIGKSPHGKSVLKALPKVGTFVE